MKNLIDDLDSIPEMFTDGFRGIMLIRRNKDGGEGNAQRKSIKRISSDTTEWKAYIRELRDMQLSTHSGHRIYSSLNSRNINKVIYEFKRRQLDLEAGGLEEYWNFYIDIENRFFSSFMNPSAREQKNFLIDCDSDEEYKKAVMQLNGLGLILYEYPTKNGMHIITKPFNQLDFEPMQVKKDDLMFIG